MSCSSIFLLAALAAPPSWAVARATEIKFATLAPEGTNAMKLMRAVDEDVRSKTQGEVAFKFYPNGRLGDEIDMVRKIRLGQLHAGGFTGVGLGEIAPEVRILDAPWFFRDAKEVDHICAAFAKDFEHAFESKGFILLGWTEVGFVYVFSKAPVRSAADMRKLKLWVWEGDPLAGAAFKALGIHPIPLSITDVNTSLETGLIDSVYTSPLYAIALQWNEKTKNLFSLPLANASGAVLLSKKVFDSLPEERRQILLAAARTHLRKLNELTRRENAAAFETLKKQGMRINPAASAQEAAVFDEAGRKARQELVGRLYSADFLARLEGALAEFRAKKK
ncbi:MAG: TRAP transporter substrate-binding protein DctP [Elusimicrobia bacterium]|nr:TRAP transporter substrate-binding protein DctP [Elusimicrobiota bacterium]